MRAYSKYKNSGIAPIGDIPSEWGTVRLKAVFDEINDRYDTSTDETLPLLSVSEYYGVAERAEKIDDDAILVRATTLDGYKMCKAGDFVSNIMLAWKCAMGMSPKDGIVSPAYCVYRVKPGFNVSYYHYLLRTGSYGEIYKTHSTGIIDSRLRLYTDEFFSIYVPVPSEEEQALIASSLDNLTAQIDQVISEAKASIDEYKQWKASIIYEAVTKGLNPNSEMTESGIGWIGKVPRGWRVQKLKTLLSKPLQYGAIESGVEYSDTLPRYIRITDVTADGDLKEEGKLSLTEEMATGYILDEGDILFARSGGTVGKAFYYQSKYGRSAFAGYMIRAKVNSNIINPKLVYYATLSANYDNWKATTMTQATIQNIGANKYNELYIVVPPLSEQEKVVEFIEQQGEKIDAIIKEKEALIQDLEALKKSLIFEVVTGKRKVV